MVTDDQVLYGCFESGGVEGMRTGHFDVTFQLPQPVQFCDQCVDFNYVLLVLRYTRSLPQVDADVNLNLDHNDNCG